LYSHVYDQTDLLVVEKKDTFSLINSPEIKLAFGIKGRDTTVVIVTPDQTYIGKKYIQDTSQTDNTLKAYTGTYYSPELDRKYGIILKDHRLMLTNDKYDDAKLTLIGKDHLVSNLWWMNHLVILHSSKNAITGFEVNSGRIMHLKFEKVSK